MKKLFVLISLLVAVSFVTNAQIKYPWAEPSQITLTSANVTAGAVALTSVYDNLTIYKVNCDTNITINAATLNARLTKGARIVFEILEATADADTITWGTNLAGAATAVPSKKRTIVEFVYTSPGFYKVAQTQVN